MPVYEYRCESCEKEFEYEQRMSDPKKTECESCGGALERLISRSNFALKGSGWYSDLYSSPKPGSATGSDSKKDSSSSSSDGSSSASSSSSDSGSSKAD